jgi:hypothetical protein
VPGQSTSGPPKVTSSSGAPPQLLNELPSDRPDRFDAVVLPSPAKALDERAAQRALQTIEAGQERPQTQRAALEKELAQAEEQIGHPLAAVKRGKATDVLREALETERPRKQTLEAQLAGPSATPVRNTDIKQVMHGLRGRLKDVRALLGRHVP